MVALADFSSGLSTGQGGDFAPALQVTQQATLVSAVTSVPLIAPGTILMYGGDTAPGGYVMTDGTNYNGLNPFYSELWGAIGLKYGGTGQSSFKVPDMQGRVPVMLGTNADVSTLGNTEPGPVALASRKPKHATTNGLSMSHTLAIGSSGSHQHLPISGGQFLFKDAAPGNGDRTWSAAAGNTDGGSQMDSPNHTHANSAFTGSITAGGTLGTSGAATDTPCFLVVNFIIKL